MKKQIKKICKNCKLYDESKGECVVVILYEGEKFKLPVSPEDDCFFENTFEDNEKYSSHIKEVKMWVEDKHGNKTDGDGVVKIEYPEGFI